MELMFIQNVSALACQNQINDHKTVRKSLPGYNDYNLRALHDPQRIAIAITVSLLLMLVIMGNIASFIANFKRNIRPIFRTCLVSLACSDLITASFVFITYISQMLNEFAAVWTLGDILCSFIPFSTTTAILANSLTLVCIALDRYIAIGNVLKGSWNPSTLFCVSCAVLVWGLAAGIASPMLTSYYLVDFYIILTDPKNHTIQLDVKLASTCISDKVSNKYFFTVVFVLIFLPLVITFVWLNSFIAKEIWYRRRPVTVKDYRSTTFSEDASNDKPTCETQASTPHDDNKKSSKSVQFDLLENSATSSNNKTPSTAATNINSTTLNAKIPSQKRSFDQKFNAESCKKKKTGREIRQLRMFTAILLLMAVFLICRLPTWFFLLYKLYYTARSNISWILNYCFGLLSLFNCVLNPLLYTFLTETIQFSYNFVSRIQHTFKKSNFGKTIDDDNFQLK